MLSKIVSLLSSKNDASRESADDRNRRITIAVCVILLEMARSDDDFAASELDHVKKVLTTGLGVAPEDVDSILAIAGREQEEAIDLWAYTNLINEKFDKEEKQRLIEMAWETAYADGRLDQNEVSLAHKSANLLHVPHAYPTGAKLKEKTGCPPPAVYLKRTLIFSMAIA
jgi:uncharacterized tellurite resistance protein B-like protein